MGTTADAQCHLMVRTFLRPRLSCPVPSSAIFRCYSHGQFFPAPKQIFLFFSIIRSSVFRFPIIRSPLSRFSVIRSSLYFGPYLISLSLWVRLDVKDECR